MLNNGGMVGKGDVPRGGDPAGAERKVLNEALRIGDGDDTSALAVRNNIQTRSTERTTDHWPARFSPSR